MTPDPLMQVAPYAQSSETSQAAAESVADRIQALEWVVLRALKKAGHHGLTREELEKATELTGNTIRPRVWALQKRGYIKESDRTRPTKSGRMAQVLLSTEKFDQ